MTEKASWNYRYGQVVEDYYIIRKLGGGKRYEVYLLCDAVKNLRVGKFLRPDQVNDPVALKVLHREGFIMSQVGAVPQIEMLGDTFLIMEYIPGPTLKRLVELNGPTLLNPLADLATRIAQLHNRLIVHLDVKPSNVVVNIERGFLIDYSIARTFGQAEKLTEAVGGTNGWRAPEQEGNGEIGPWTDVWGFGATAYYALTGEKPGEHGYEVPNIVAECLVPWPESRPSMDDVVQALVD